MPATLLVAKGVQRRHAERVVIDEADLRIGVGSRIGLIGPNGSGKTTLLRVLAGDEQADAGSVTAYGTVGLLGQVPDHTTTGCDTILQQIGITAATAELERQSGRLERGDLDGIDAHAAALERWLSLGGADADARLQTVAAEFGLKDELLKRPMASLSGGQAARVGLAAIALAKYDVMLLDEPTNHLDGDGLARLAKLLRQPSGGFVIASHNRQLLADVCTEIVSIDRHTGRLTHYGGGYETYEREHDAAHRRAVADHREAVQERTRLRAAEAEIRRRGARTIESSRPENARDNDKSVRKFLKASGEAASGRARTMGDRIERIEVPEKPWEQRPLRLGLTAGERRQPWVVSLQQATWHRGADWSLGPLDLTVAHGERLILRGPNGSGKSTILATIAGRLQPTSGQVQIARSAVIAELGQTRSALERASTVSKAVRAKTGLDETDARNALAWFGLKAEHADQLPRRLSPGELTRAELAVLAHMNASCLLLDEPTNHLDIESVEVLEAALKDWPGALIVATHDTRMIEKLAPDREIALAG